MEKVSSISPFCHIDMSRRCKKRVILVEITRQEYASDLDAFLRCARSISLGATFSLIFLKTFLHLGFANQVPCNSRFRAANGCRDNRSQPFSLRRPTFWRSGAGRCSLVSSWPLLPRDAALRWRESPDLERETVAAAARFSRHIPSRRVLRFARREKNVESCGLPTRAIVVAGESGLEDFRDPPALGEFDFARLWFRIGDWSSNVTSFLSISQILAFYSRNLQ